MSWFLFETRLGNWLLGLIERRCGLAVVQCETLSEVVVWPTTGGGW